MAFVDDIAAFDRAAAATDKARDEQDAAAGLVLPVLAKLGPGEYLVHAGRVYQGCTYGVVYGAAVSLDGLMSRLSDEGPASID